MAIVVKDLSKMIDHSLLHPTMGFKELKEGCDLAMKWDVATVCVKPYDVAKARMLLRESDVRVCSVIGFPHGNSKISIKTTETREACIDGADEIDMVINIGKALEKNYIYIEDEIRSIHNVAKRGGAALKVIFENDFLDRETIVELCSICNRVGVEFIKTSSGYGFVKQEDGSYSYDGATQEDLKLMVKNSRNGIQVKAAGGIRTLEDLLYVKSIGVTRIGCTATEEILKKASEYIVTGGDLEDLVPDNLSKTKGY